MTQPDPKYVSASQPVNRRTAKPVARAEQLSPVVQERLAAKWADQHIKSRFGLPLAEQLREAAKPAQTTAMGPLFIAGGVVCAASAVSLLLGVVAHSTLLAVSGVLELAGGAGLMFYSHRSQAVSAPEAPSTGGLFDQTSLLAFDRAVGSMAADAPDRVVTALTALKRQLARIAQQAANAPVDEHFTLDDRLYLTQLLRRYLPDSLQAYLLVPKDQRAAPVLEQGASAISLLLGQLELLGQELDQREEKLTKSKAENLLRQQRFLESKRSR